MATQEGARRVSPVILVLGGLTLVALVVFVITNVLGGGGEPPVPTAPPVAAPPGGAAAAPPAPAATPEATEVFEIFEGRDPFKTLAFAAPPATPAPGGAAATPAPGTTAAPSTTAAPTTTGAPTTTAAPTSTGTTTTTPSRTPAPSSSGVVVEVLSVAANSSSATVRVGSNVFMNARPRQALSDGVVVDLIQGKCVHFHRGTDRFRLCEGEMVLK